MSRDTIQGGSKWVGGRNWTGVQIMALMLVVCFAVTTAVGSFIVDSRHLNKRSFFDIECKGVYDKGIFSKLDRVCDDCYNLYRDPHLHSLCSQKCFSTPYFMGCVDALTLSENEKEYKRWILTINANNPFDDPTDSLEKLQ